MFPEGGVGLVSFAVWRGGLGWVVQVGSAANVWLRCVMAIKRPREQAITLHSSVWISDGYMIALRASDDLPVGAGEEANQHHLACATRVQAPQDRDGQDHDVDVYDDAGYRTAEEPVIGTEAASGDPWEPSFADRSALEDGGWDGGKEPCGDEACGNQYVDAEDGCVVPLEDSDVEEDGRIFGQRDSEMVEAANRVSIFERQSEFL